MRSSEYIDLDRPIAVILTSSHTLTGKLLETTKDMLILVPEDDLHGVILILWASVLYLMQNSEAKVVPHG